MSPRTARGARRPSPQPAPEQPKREISPPQHRGGRYVDGERVEGIDEPDAQPEHSGTDAPEEGEE